MSGNAYIKYLTEQITTYIDLPSETRKQLRSKRKQDANYGSHWFGILPFALKMFLTKQNNR